jgi:acyl-CoA thioesterase FadM
MHQNVCRDGDILVEGMVKVACISSETKRPLAMPKEIYATLSHYLN